MTYTLGKEEFAKILIHCHQDSVFSGGAIEEDPISRVGTQILAFHDVMPLRAQPVRQAPARTPVDEEFQWPATRTASRDLSAMTAWAYAKQARMSSASRPG